MRLTVKRIKSDAESTLGELYVDGVLECYTLEDEYRAQKVAGETRIPAGAYKLRLRTEGGKHEVYKQKFKHQPGFHKGMLELKDVPGFKYILIHIGNSHDDSDGCLLVGQRHTIVEGHYYVTQSRAAYEKLYPKVRDAILRGEGASIEIAGDEPDEAAA